VVLEPFLVPACLSCPSDNAGLLTAERSPEDPTPQRIDPSCHHSPHTKYAGRLIQAAPGRLASSARHGS